MYNDTIKVANKIISDKDLEEIFQKMFDALQENVKINKQEKILNQRYDSDYQHWTVKDFEGVFKVTVDFYDDTSIFFDNYNNFITIFNSRLDEIKCMYVTYRYSYCIKNGRELKFINKTISMNVYENKMNIDINLSSDDKKMFDVYDLIKEKILNAPEKYDMIIKKKSSITSRVAFALGLIPSLIICTLLLFIPTIRQIFFEIYVLYPIIVILFGFIIGGTVFGGKLDSLYSTIIPKKKYVSYHSRYEDDIDEYIQSGEIIIGNNINNLKNRKEIADIDSKYSKYIPVELIIILIISLIIILLRNFVI